MKDTCWDYQFKNFKMVILPWVIIQNIREYGFYLNIQKNPQKNKMSLKTLTAIASY